MGRATIVSEIGEGQYRIEMDYGDDIIQRQLSTLNSTQARLEAETPALQSELSAAQSTADGLLLDVDNAIHDYSAALIAGGDGSEEKTALNLILTSHNKAKLEVVRARTRLGTNTALLANTTSRISYLQGFELVTEIDAWCVDYTLEASGTVATIEVPGEPVATLIAPGGEEGEIPEPAPADGQVLARAAQTPEQLFFNLALLPGWQKWMPTYRFGEITTIDYENDECEIALDDAESSAQNLNINKLNSLSGVPIEYMDCHAASFETGDRVIVKFDGQSWDDPKVIGFKDNPKGCDSWLRKYKRFPHPGGVHGFYEIELTRRETLFAELYEDSFANYYFDGWVNGIPNGLSIYRHNVTDLIYDGIPDIAIYWKKDGGAWNSVPYSRSRGTGTPVPTLIIYKYTDGIPGGDLVELTVEHPAQEEGYSVYFGEIRLTTEFNDDERNIPGITELLVRQVSTGFIFFHVAMDMDAVTIAKANISQTEGLTYNPAVPPFFFPISGFEMQKLTGYVLSAPPP